MVFAYANQPKHKLRWHETYKKCVYCPNCGAIYTPNMLWGYCWSPRNSTSPLDDEWTGIHRKGMECPMCDNREGVEELSIR